MDSRYKRGTLSGGFDTAGTPGSATNRVAITNNTIQGASAAVGTGAEGMVFVVNHSGAGLYPTPVQDRDYFASTPVATSAATTSSSVNNPSTRQVTVPSASMT